MTAFALDTLTHRDRATILALAAELEENAIKDKTYEHTPIGGLVRRYLDELTFDNYSPRTVQGREYILARLSLRFAHRELGEITYDDLREFLAGWKDSAANTRAVYVSTVKNFVRWAHERDAIPNDPAKKLRGPRAKDTDRRAHSAKKIRELILSQPVERDRVALLVAYWCALRRNELRLIQFKHLDLRARMLVVYGKGGKIKEQNIPEQLALHLEAYILERGPDGEEFLLHPQRLGRVGEWPRYEPIIIWENRRRPLSMSGIDKWWQRCLERAGMEQFPMHEIRHSAITHFHLSGHDLYATQQFARHASPATTARVYLHLDTQREVAAVQRRMSDPLEVSE